jgi:hypothetical protein
MSDGVRVWIATDPNDFQWVTTGEKPKWIDGEHGFDMREPFDSFQQGHGINVPPGECREFRLVPVGEAEPQPVAVPQGVREWAENIFKGVFYTDIEHNDDRVPVANFIELLSRPTTLQPSTGDAETIAALRAELVIARRRVAELEAKPQPVKVTPLALFIAKEALTLFDDGKGPALHHVTGIVENFVKAAIAAAARIEGGDDAAN